MSLHHNIIVFQKEEKSRIHMQGDDGNYVTACGLDGQDESADQFGFDVTHKPINCHQCWRVFKSAQKYTKKNFSRGVIK